MSRAGVAKLQIGSPIPRAKKGFYVLNSVGEGDGGIKSRIEHVKLRFQCPYIRLYWNMATPIH